MSSFHFGFGRPSPPMPTGGAVYAPPPGAPQAAYGGAPPQQWPDGDPGLNMGGMFATSAPQAIAPQAIASGGQPPASPGDGIRPIDIFNEMHSLRDYHGAHQRLIQEQLNQAYAARDSQMQDAAIKALGSGPDADKQAYALHHDPASFSTSTNKVQEPVTVAAGASHGAGGRFGFTAPDPVGQETAAAATTSAAANAANAANNANETALKTLSNPAAIDKLRSDAEWNRRRSAGGAARAPGGAQADIMTAYGLKPGAAR